MSGDGYRWHCKCGKTKSIRSGTVLCKTKLGLKEVMLMIYFWSHESSCKNIRSFIGHTSKTIGNWCQILRNLCCRWIRDYPFEFGGLNDNLDPVIVEVDETKFFNRKYSKGRYKQGHHVFGTFERNTKKCSFHIIPKRKAAHILPLIRAHLLPGGFNN